MSGSVPPEDTEEVPKPYNLEVRIPREDGYDVVARASVPFIFVPRGQDPDDTEIASQNTRAAAAWLVELCRGLLAAGGWNVVPEESRAYFVQGLALFPLCDIHGDYSDVVVNFGKGVEAFLRRLTALPLALGAFARTFRDEPEKLKLFMAAEAPVERIAEMIIEVNNLRRRGAHASAGRRATSRQISSEEAMTAHEMIFGRPNEMGLIEMLATYGRAEQAGS